MSLDQPAENASPASPLLSNQPSSTDGDEGAVLGDTPSTPRTTPWQSRLVSPEVEAPAVAVHITSPSQQVSSASSPEASSSTPPMHAQPRRRTVSTPMPTRPRERADIPSDVLRLSIGRRVSAFLGIITEQAASPRVHRELLDIGNKLAVSSPGGVVDFISANLLEDQGDVSIDMDIDSDLISPIKATTDAQASSGSTTPPSPPPLSLVTQSEVQGAPSGISSCLEEMDELDNIWSTFREACAVFSGGFEEVMIRISHDLKHHQCSTTSPVQVVTQLDPSIVAENENLKQQVFQLTRNNQALTGRVSKAEAEAQKSQTLHARLNKQVADAELKNAETIKAAEVRIHALQRRNQEIAKRYIELKEDHQLLSDRAARTELAEGTPFILVLMEGEARMFDPRQLHLGFEGGANVAQTIRAQTERLQKMFAPNSKEALIMIYLFMDVTIDDLLEHKVIRNPQAFDAFMEGFSSADDHVTISDVTGKFGASVKIRAQMNTLGTLRSCKLIFLAAGQNRQYIEAVNNLSPADRDKVYCARSTGPLNASEDPFRPLGDDRLYFIECLFPTSMQEWSVQVQAQSTGAQVVGHPPIQPNPALVPNPVLHPPFDRSREVQPHRYGSPILFTPTPTGHHGRQSEGYRPLHSSATNRSSTAYERSYNSPDRETTPRPRPITPRGPPKASQPPWSEYRPVPPAESRPPPSDYRPQSSSTSTSRPYSERPTLLRQPAPRRPAPSQRYQGSVGGSPPSSEDEEPLLAHVPQASRTHVIRPPVFSVDRPPSTGSLISTATVGPPSAWQGHVRSYVDQRLTRDHLGYDLDMSSDAKVENWRKFRS